MANKMRLLDAVWLKIIGRETGYVTAECVVLYCDCTDGPFLVPSDPDPVPQASPAAQRRPVANVHGGSGHQLVFPQNEGRTGTD